MKEVSSSFFSSFRAHAWFLCFALRLPCFFLPASASVSYTDEDKRLILYSERVYPNGDAIFTTRQSSSQKLILQGYEDLLYTNIVGYLSGSSIYNVDILELIDNRAVSFNKCSVLSGGSVYNYSGDFTLARNEDVSFIANKASEIGDIQYYYGSGSIFNYAVNASFRLNSNGTVEFRENTVSYSGPLSNSHFYGGGAIYNHGEYGTCFSLCNNEIVSFIGNVASAKSYYFYAGGGIYNDGDFLLRDNKIVIFSNNATSLNYCVSPAYYGGGAIYNKRNFTFSNNETVIFTGNESSSISTSISLMNHGGAIFNEGTFSLFGNGDVLFEKNYVRGDNTCLLRSIYSTGILNLSASDGKCVTFRDSVYARNMVELNRTGAGDIIFTGATTERDLREMKGGVDGTETEIRNSRTSRFATLTNLYGGRLIVEDGAILEGYGIIASCNSEAVVRLKDGALNHDGYALIFNACTTLEVEGKNFVTASSVAMKSGSTLSFVVGNANLTTATLTMIGNLATESLSVSISGLDVLDKRPHAYALLTTTGYDESTWTADLITVQTEGVRFDDLVWNNGTLYLNYGALPDLSMALWNNASVDGLWNAASVNWTQDGYSYAYSDGVDVIFGNEGAGTVSLEGGLSPKSVLVDNDRGFDYTFAGEGQLTGAAALTKEGEGKLTIDIANKYSGGTKINAGTIVVGHRSALGVGEVVLNNGILDLGGYFVHNCITANGGTLIGAEGYAGTLTVNGNVNLAGYAHTSIELNSGRLTAAETLELENGQSLSFKGGRLTGDVLTGTGSTLTLGSNATLNGNLTLDGGQLALNGNTLAVAGALNLVSTTSVDISSYAIGTYKLLTFGALEGRLDNLVLSGSRYRTSVSEENGALTLTVKALNNTLTWNQPKGVWTTNGNFGSGIFREDDDVIFRSAANVTISGTVKPGTIVVNTPDKVTFTSDKKVYGSGISGDASVTKNGAGLLTMNAGNTYTGGTTLNAGTLKATAVDSFGTGGITVNGGTLDLGSKAVANDIVLSGEATLKGDAKYVGNVTVEGDATLLAKASYKGMTTIGAGSTLTLAPKATMAGSIILDDGTLNITAPKGMTLAKNMTMLLNGGSVSGLLTIGSGSTLVWQDGSFDSSAPVLKGGTVDLGGEKTLTLTGSKAQVQFGDKALDLPGKGTVCTNDALTVNSGTVTVNSMGGYEGEIAVNGGTLKLSTGKLTTENDIIVKGTAAVVNGGTHYGDITVDGLLAKGTTIKLLNSEQRVTLNGSGEMLGSISGKGIVDVRGDVDITGAKLTNANILLGGTLTHAKGLTLAKGQTLTLNGGSVNGTLTVGNGAVLDLNGHTLIAAPVLKGGTYDDGGSNTLTLTGAKADISLGEQQVSLLSKSFIKSDAVLTVNSGTVTVNDFGTSEQELTVTGGTLKLATGKQTSRNTIVVNGTAAVVNGATHYGDIEVNGELAKGTTIKLLTADQRVVLKGGETLLGTISGAGIIDVNASIDATAAKLTAATINLNACTFTNTKGIKLAKGQTLNLTGASLELGTKGVLATVAGSTLGVSGSNTLTGSLTLGGGELVFSEGGTLTLDGTLTLSKPVTVTGSGSITYDTLKPIKGELSAFFGDAEVKQDGNTILIMGNAPTLRLAAAPLAAAAEAPAPLDAAPAIPVVNPVADAMVQADWGILDAERAFMGAVNNRSQHATLLDKGMGAAWVSAFGASVRHGNQGTHHGSDGTLSGAAFGLEHAVSETGTLGLAVGRSKNRIAATGVTHLRQETAHVALYGQKQLKHGFTADAAATYGDTETKLGAASWQQKSAAFSARLTHARMLTDATAFRTFGGLTYEATDAGCIGTVHTGSVQNLRAEVGAGATHTVGKAHFYAEAALTGDMVRHNPTVDFDGVRTHGANPGRLGLRATVGGIYEFTDTWSGTASYGIEAESRSTSHTLNIGVSKSF